jgi:putative redox protein
MRKVKAVSSKKPYAVEITTDQHHWNADEPPDRGGGDIGPSPNELLLSAVGACMAITARMYAERKGWPLDLVQVELDYSRVRAEECDDCETEKGFVSVLQIDFSLQGDLDEAQKQRVLEIAGRCPVKRTLEGEVKVKSRLQGD